MTAILKTILKRRWLFVVGVCFFGLTLFGGQISGFTQFNILSELNAPDVSVSAIVLIIIVSTFVSEDLTCLTAGTLVSQGKLSFMLAVFACSLGIFIGDILLFWTGRIFGRKALKINFVARMFSEDAIMRSSKLLETYGMLAVLLSRLTPGLRLPLYLMAGILKTRFLKFTIFFLIATILWTPIIVGVPAFFGDYLLKASPMLRDNFWLGLFVTVAVAFGILKTLMKLVTWKGRRLFLGKLKRIYKWEFWSLKVFYLPVAVYVGILVIKFRSVTVFTCANPAIVASGFVGESKAQILDLLASGSNEEHLLQFELVERELPLEKKVEKSKNFVARENIGFPLVVKPDAGERGDGVSIVNSFDELLARIENSKYDLILHEFAGGVETSVFYYRFPGEKCGRIFSITEKRFPEVVGNGRSTLEELILSDKRAICLAEKYFHANVEKLGEIPEDGEKVKLVEIGTHSRGAIFLDGGWMKTDTLEKKIDSICQSFEGFYFGRFDIRASSFEAFSRGEDFKVIELNGVTSESTNIYDPVYSLFDAYRILFRQWKIAFEIGHRNFLLGTKKTAFLDLARLIKDHLRR